MSASTTVTWNAPNTPSTTYTITCVATDAPWGAGSTPVAVPIDVTIAGTPPVIDSLTAADTELFVGTSTLVTVVAHDPGGGALTYAWSATGGAITGDQDGDPNVVTWTASPAPGTFVVSVVVTKGVGVQTGGSIAIDATLAQAVGTMDGLPTTPLTPNRLAVDGSGLIFVTDTRAGLIWVHTPLGEVLRTIPVGGKPAGIAITTGGTLLVGDSLSGAVDILDSDGNLLGSLGNGKRSWRNISGRNVSLRESQGTGDRNTTTPSADL